MIKTLAKAQQQERVKFRVPRSVQDAIPIRRIWSDGIFLCGNQYIQHDRYVPAQVSDTGKRAMTHRAVALYRAIPLAPKAAMIRCFATTLDGVIMIRLLPRTSDGAAEPWLQC